MNHNFKRRYQRLERDYPNKKMGEKLGLINNSDINNEIGYYKEGPKIYWKFYSSKLKYREAAEYIKTIDIGLPFELNCIIAEFVIEKSYIELIFLQFFPTIYPFRRPFFEILNCEFNSKNQSDKENNLKKIFKMHRRKLWNANILIDKDILDLYVDLDLEKYL